jgi:hypothetical protein
MGLTTWASLPGLRGMSPSTLVMTSCHRCSCITNEQKVDNMVSRGIVPLIIGRQLLCKDYSLLNMLKRKQFLPSKTILQALVEFMQYFARSFYRRLVFFCGKSLQN